MVECLKLNSMRLANIPPPMALHEIILEEPAIDVAITIEHEETLSARMAVLHHTGVSLWQWPLTSLAQSPPVHKWSHSLCGGIERPGLTSVQIAWSGDGILILFNYIGATGVEIISTDGALLASQASLDADSECVISDGLSSSVGPSLTLKTKEDCGALTLESLFNQLQSFGIKELALKTPASVPGNEAVRYCRESGPDVIFSLTENGSLFADERRLARNCTSFLVTPAHLIFTTSQHLLKFVHLPDVTGGEALSDADDDRNRPALDVPPDTPEKDERCRSIERGAKLVTIMPSIFALVMQMPRGNLETIYPRALVLPSIRHSIDAMKYRKAFLACRNQRVDMNILHDHDPEQFIANIGLLIDQLRSIGYIDLFLSQLR